MICRTNSDSIIDRDLIWFYCGEDLIWLSEKLQFDCRKYFYLIIGKIRFEFLKTFDSIFDNTLIVAKTLWIVQKALIPSLKKLWIECLKNWFDSRKSSDSIVKTGSARFSTIFEKSLILVIGKKNYIWLPKNVWFDCGKILE